MGRSGLEAVRGLPDSYEMPVSIVGVISGLPSAGLDARRMARPYAVVVNRRSPGQRVGC
jgi:hypothetical protein